MDSYVYLDHEGFDPIHKRTGLMESAIRNLRPGAGFTVRVIDGEIEIEYDEGVSPPSSEEISNEVAAIEVEWGANEYQQKRRNLYPAIGDQLDDLFRKNAFSDEMAAKLQAVKDAHPKPE